MKKFALSMLAGTVVGIIDIIPMFIQNLPMLEILSAFSLWVVVAYFNYHVSMPIKSALKGIAVSFPVWIPALFLVIPQGFQLIMIISLTNIVLGSLLGFVIERIKK